MSKKNIFSYPKNIFSYPKSMKNTFNDDEKNKRSNYNLDGQKKQDLRIINYLTFQSSRVCHEK